MSKKPEASKTFISDVHEKGFEGERTFRKYCDEHQIILCNPTNGMSLVIDEINGYGEDWPEFSSSVLDSDPWGQVFYSYERFGKQARELKSQDCYSSFERFSDPPTIQDYHCKIMKDRELLGDKNVGYIDYCSFENMSLYEVKHWTERPSFGKLTRAQKEAMRKCVGKWKCFIVWVKKGKNRKEIELIEVTKQEILCQKNSVSILEKENKNRSKSNYKKRECLRK